jgi:hypothetical protein
MNSGSHHHPASNYPILSTLVQRAGAMDDQDRFHMEQMFLGDTFRELELWMIKTDFMWS